MSALIILTIVCALTYTFEIVFGLAGTILMLPLLSFLFPVKTLVVYSVLPQILVAVIGLVRSPKKVDRKFLAGLAGRKDVEIVMPEPASRGALTSGCTS